MEEHCQWNMLQTTLFLELWGRVQVQDGGFTETELLAVTTILDVEILENLRADQLAVDYLEDEETETMLGQPFALAVHERFVALSKLRRPEPTG